MSILRVNTIQNASGGSAIDVPGAAKVFVNFTGSGTVSIRGSLNVTSITDNGVGDYTVNYTSALASANYAVACTAANTASGNTNTITCGLYAASAGVGASSLTTSSVRVSTRTSNGNQIDTDCVNVVAYI